jgi:hypothetical protein
MEKQQIEQQQRWNNSNASKSSNASNSSNTLKNKVEDSPTIHGRSLWPNYRPLLPMFLATESQVIVYEEQY